MPTRDQARNQGGRPRDSRVDDAIASAVLELLSEVGYARLTIAEVAARAGVGKAAIYRRHATKQEMIFDVLVQGQFLAVAPDNGSLRADLAAVLADIADDMAAPPPGTLPGLLADIHADPVLLDRFDEKYLGAQRRTLAEILDRAAARGEIATRPDPTALNALLVGPVFAWLFLLSESPDRLPALTSALLDAALALTGSSTGRSAT
ncbi:TetR/AcrR family transcriptional regulator [Saccharopolyspora indica]|uniref:TetR/AcrR family transcriptional regulator n=1 Tax=Saccharopolyspora indica TaxID=1229659 RepID=UPI0022EABF71|nr:TetR/AcrR family transcriptional regulator [Saccharopolyspora indica]MDA3645817.1 TetR/AcrR family transcriptional regulator [Saccharopolyspora indica]